MRYRKFEFYGLLIAFCATAGCCLGIGILFGEWSECRAECQNQKREIEAVLNANPMFANVRVENMCDGNHAMLSGRVETQSDWNLLLTLMTEAIGKERAKYAVSFVDYPDPKKP
jgi:hypothetical protein